MNRPSRTTRWAAYVAAAVAMTALAPTAPASAEIRTTSVVLASGENPASINDAFTQMSTDGGATWTQGPPIVEPDREWDVLPGSRWLSTDRDLGRSRVDATTLFRRTFVLPAGLNHVDLFLCVLADTTATVRLNGTVVIAQGSSDLANSHTPADCYAERTLITPTLLRPGPNVLDFAVYNNGGPTGLDYRADLSYATDLDAPPALLLPDDMTVDATSPDGATVWFEARALDTGETGLWLVPTCTPGPNAVFPVGTTTVTCTATGSRGTTSTGTFDVTVTAPDQPPVLQLPAAITIDAVSPSGSPVTYAVTATDDGTATVTCAPASGSTFAIGTTTVDCMAVDDDGATATGSFPVAVRGAREQLARFLVALTGVSPTSSYAATVTTIVNKLPDRSLPLACEPLRLITKALQAQSGRLVPAARAAALIADATRIRAVLACR